MSKPIRIKIVGDPVEAKKILRLEELSLGDTLEIDNPETGLGLADENPDLFMLDDEERD